LNSENPYLVSIILISSCVHALVTFYLFEGATLKLAYHHFIFFKNIGHALNRSTSLDPELQNKNKFYSPQ
jgi:hypothetical protein